MQSIKTIKTRPSIIRSIVHATILGGVAASSASALDVLVVDSAGPYTTIQAAVLASTAEDVILVNAGVYSGRIRVTGGGRTIVGRDDCLINGSIEFHGTPGDETTLLAGLRVMRPSNGVAQTVRSGAIHFEDCAGPVRVVDCTTYGEDSQYRPTIFVTAEGGPGLLATNCRDVALIGCTATGGEGVATVGPPGGRGGEGLLLADVGRATVMRSLTYGGLGGIGDDGGDGGNGIHVLGATILHLDYSLCHGGDGRDAETFGFPLSGGSGGHGLVAGTQAIWDFQSVFIGGGFGIGNPSFGGDGLPGQEVMGGSSLQLLEGHPSRLQIPLIVQEGEAYERRVSGVSGERISHQLSSRTGFDFSIGLRQPRLVGAPPVSTVATVGPIVSPSQFGSFTEIVTAPLLPRGSDVSIQWRSALCLDSSGGARQTSSRPLIVLKAGL